MFQVSLLKQNLLVLVFDQTIGIYVCNRLKNLLLEVFLHLCHIAHAFIREPLELGIVDVRPVHCLG